ncbi:GFA family protein [Halomonas elongata]|uniref:GFA family protein n=2 Tax=Halomonas elongata TaxID=2746 RepID=E1V5E2_HALED|nr:GFA family protein [Halomonas elongata]MBW5799950.1 GFA family protein [Halomonas elongata]MDL4863576.1 GFA family protein [Halomonas elongata]OBX33817.1 putative glutathione-dependent formaldehyde-activating enzyme [Halomonas elongata]RAW07467.1 GFA family protein [Halomonas elongata]WBF16837.1 GFA family protein [Halomonas elongata]
MNDAMTLRGSCLCGAVTLSVEAERQNVAACHCQMCRTWGGGPLLAMESVGRVTLEGEDQVSIYASSDWAERGFCRHCGTHLFYRLRTGEHYAVPVGLVDSGEAWTFDSQIFIDEKPGWYHFGNATKDLTGQQVFEAFQAGEE